MSRLSAWLQLGLLVVAADLIALANQGTAAPFWVFALLAVGLLLVLFGWRRTLALEKEWQEDSWFDYAAASGVWLDELRNYSIGAGLLDESTRVPDSLVDTYASWESISEDHALKRSLLRYYHHAENPGICSARQTMKKYYQRWSRLLGRFRWNQPLGFSDWLEGKGVLHRPVFELWALAQCALFDCRESLIDEPTFEGFQKLWDHWRTEDEEQ